jgi:hypothetical protein
MIVVVPDCLRNAINEALDRAIAECPGAAHERSILFDQLLGYFDEHGVIPDFTLAKRKSDP